MPLWVSHVNRWVKPEEMQRSAIRGIENPFTPDYTRDPTYHLRKTKS